MTKGIIRKNLPLTVDRARELLKYDRTAGGLFWRVKGRGKGIGNRASAVCGNYRQICVDGLNIKEHRLIWFIVTGSWPADLVDHQNGVGTDNRWSNLRPATYRQNAHNRRPGKRSKTGRIGVCQDQATGKWMAHIGVNGKSLTLGRFRCFDDAVSVRCEAERHHFGSFATDAARYPTDAAE